MNIRTSLGWIALFSLGLTIAARPADAKKKGKTSQDTEQTASSDASQGSAEESSTDVQSLEIEKTGVASFDEVFDKANGMLTQLQQADSRFTDANTKLNTVLGLPEGTPVADALKDLETKAGDKLQVAMEGTTPAFSVADDAPDNVKQGVDAVKQLLDACTAVEGAVKAVAKDSDALISAASALPGKIPAEMKAGNIKLSELKTIKNSVSNNVEVVKALPGAAEDLGKEAGNTVSLVKTTFVG